MENILFVTSKYSHDNTNLYLTNDLVDQLLKEQCMVSVVSYGDKEINRTASDGMIKERIIKVNKTPKYIKYMLVWYKLFLIVRKMVKVNNITKAIFIAPLIVLWPAVLALRLCNCKEKICIVFDIFPDHQTQINVIPPFLTSILRRVEIFLLSSFNVITGMTPENVKAIKRTYGKSLQNKCFKVIPPWYGRVNENNMSIPDKKPGELNIVFGGQICKGRDLTKAIELLDLLRKRENNINLTIYTDTISAQSISSHLQSIEWIELRDYLPRKQYLEELTKYNFGLIVTDPKVNLPTFPSKIIDYLTLNLRCLCLLEKVSDLDEILPFKTIIHVNKFCFDISAIEAAENFLKNNIINNVDFITARRILSVEEATKKLLEDT